MLTGLMSTPDDDAPTDNYFPAETSEEAASRRMFAISPSTIILSTPGQSDLIDN